MKIAVTSGTTFAPRLLAARKQALSGESQEVSIEYRYRHPERGEVWIRQLSRATTRDPSGTAIQTFSVILDVTERKQTEETLRGLNRRLVSAQEAERALIARELHDDLSQRLALLAIDAGDAKKGAK